MQSTLVETVKLPCAREYFFQMALTAWGYCRADIPLFSGESDRYDVKFIEAREKLIGDVRNLPDVGVRYAEATEANEALAARCKLASPAAKT